jgi:glutamate racemase
MARFDSATLGTMNVQSAPIGIFDSGLGGLSVAREIRRLLPSEQLLYAADSRFCPYGVRSSEEIRWRSQLIAESLIERGAKLLVIACNTATAVALEELRSRFRVPVVGLEPAVKPAVGQSRNGRIAVLATSRTAESARLLSLIARYGGDTRIHVVPAPGLVELVEGGETTGPEIESFLRPMIEPLVDAGVDTIVLGCTHYPFVGSAIRSICGAGVSLIDSGSAIARRTRDLLTLHDLASQQPSWGRLRILTTGETERVAEVASRLLAEHVEAEWLDLAGGMSYEAALEPKLSAAWTVSNSAGA